MTARASRRIPPPAHAVNPIEKLERSSLIIAETIQGAPAATLIKQQERERLAMYSAPMLLTGGA